MHQVISLILLLFHCLIHVSPQNPLALNHTKRIILCMTWLRKVHPVSVAKAICIVSIANYLWKSTDNMISSSFPQPTAFSLNSKQSWVQGFHVFLQMMGSPLFQREMIDGQIVKLHLSYEIKRSSTKSQGQFAKGIIRGMCWRIGLSFLKRK